MIPIIDKEPQQKAKTTDKIDKTKDKKIPIIDKRTE